MPEGSEVNTIYDAGHYMHNDNPNGVIAEILEFVWGSYKRKDFVKFLRDMEDQEERELRKRIEENKRMY